MSASMISYLLILSGVFVTAWLFPRGVALFERLEKEELVGKVAFAVAFGLAVVVLKLI